MSPFRRFSHRFWPLHAYLAASMALWPVPAARSYWTWDASSGAKAEVANPPEGDLWFDLDSDGDSLTNAQEALFGSDPYQIDTDQDGLRDDAEQQLSDPTAPFDPWLWDSNSNGYSDHDELYQRLQGYVPVVHYPSLSSSGRPFFSYSDADGDGLKNHEDSDPLNMDRDSDGILNWNDTAYMDDANNGYIPPPPVTDPGVWIGGNWYPTGTLDSDNDGMPDPYDPFPWGSFWYSGIEYGGWWTDSDGDGIPNPADGFPNGSFWYNTTEYAGLWVDRDGDGIPDPADLWPTIAYSFWYNAQEYPGIWSDQDSDSIPDAADPFPNGSYWWNGREHSGAWVDSDYDSIPDAHDAHPNGSFWYNSIEYSGTWTDMDADGIPDPADPFPQGGSYWYNAVEYAGPWSDRDSDTIPDPADVTPDGGYWFNGTEYGGSWMDWDGDGVPDPADLWPHDRWNNEPHFNYNGTDYAGVWHDRDSDNVPDPADAYPDDPENNADTDGDGLSNYHERTQHGTDPTLRDTDGEGLTDSEELYTYHTNPLEQKTHPNKPYTDYYTVDQTDTDGDGVPDRIEQWYAQLGYAMGSGTTDDAKADFDGDGYSNVQAYRNGWSFIAHLNHYDHDQDGILDVLEDMWSVSYPGILSSSNFEDAVQDYDGDGLMNYEEVALGLNPGSAHSRSTTVHDRQEWAWRQSMSTKAAWQALEDANQDGVPEGLAAFVNDDNAGSSGITLPQRAAWGDYDGDGMPDVWEYRHHLHLRDASDAQGNPDGDSLTNLLEFQQNRDPWIQEVPPPPPLALGGHVPNGAVGEPYSATVAASGGTPGYSYSVSSGALPGGLSLDSSSGTISGTPSNDGSFDFTVSVNDSTGQMANASYDVTIAGLEIATEALPVAIRDTPYTTMITAVHGTGPYSFVNIGNDLPFDYSLASNGTLTGNTFGIGSSTAGSYAFTVEVTDSAGRTATQTLTLVIEDAPPPPPLHFVTTQLPNAMAGWNYSSRLIVGGAQGTPTFSITGQPAWLQLSADGTLSGTPPTTGIHSFSVQVRDELYDPSLASFRTTSATFTLQQTGYQPVILTLLSGNRQNGVPGQPLPLPLVVRVTLNGEPMAGASVMFGDIPLTTHANGTASTHWLCPPSEGGFQVPVTSGSGSSVFQAWAIHPRGGHGSSLPRLDFNATAGPPPTPNTHNLLAHDAEVSLESRFVSENGGQIEAQYSQHVYKMADQGSGLTMLHQSGLPPYTQNRTNWSTSDGTAGREPEAPVPPLTQLTQWVPGATDGYHFSGKDTESGPVEGGPNESGGAGDGLPHVDHLLQEPGTFLDAGWFGRAQGMYQRTSSEVRLRRRTPSPATPLPEIRRTFLLVTYETDANGVETLTQTEVKSLTMSPSENESHPLQLSPEAPAPGKSKRLRLMPIEVVELSPKTKDEDGNDIAGSEKPSSGRPLTQFVEIDPNTNKIAHRELKVMIGSALKDKKVTWTLEALPGATPATIRGEWDDSPTHKDRFEASTAYGANGFRKVSQSSGETTVGADGHTAIRVNVPPIGFNQVRIKIQIEGTSTPIDLIDMEVPGVVIIDPGHGGNDSGAVGSTDTTVLEKDLALEYSLSLKQKVTDKFGAEKHGLKLYMTRKTTGEYMENSARANLAKDKGADVFISIHFNSGASTARGTETLVRGNSNVNEVEDTTLANLFLTSVLAAVQSQDAAAVNRGVKNYAWSQSQQQNVPSQWAVLSDSGYGNTNDYHPIRGSIVEVEFLSHETALETVKLSNATGTAIKTKFAADVSTDIYNNILNQP